MKQQASVEIACPIEEVFEFTNNHVAEWSLTVVENELIDEKPGGVGTTFRCIAANGHQQLELAGVVTRHEPPYASAIQLTGPMFDIEVEYIFKNLGDRTEVTQYSSVTPKGVLKVFFFLFGRMMNKGGCQAAEKELLNLKRLLEDRVSTNPPS